MRINERKPLEIEVDLELSFVLAFRFRAAHDLYGERIWTLGIESRVSHDSDSLLFWSQGLRTATVHAGEWLCMHHLYPHRRCLVQFLV